MIKLSISDPLDVTNVINIDSKRLKKQIDIEDEETMAHINIYGETIHSDASL